MNTFAAWVQILTELGTASAIVFYAGKFAQKSKDHDDDIKELKVSRKEQWEKLNEHDKELIRLNVYIPGHGRRN